MTVPYKPYPARVPRNLPSSGEGASEAKKAIAELVAQVRSKPAAPIGVTIDWVFQHVEIAWDEIDVEGIPDAGAVALLGFAKEGPGEFYKLYHARLLPSKAEIDRSVKSTSETVDLDAVDAMLLEAIEAAGVDT